MRLPRPLHLLLVLGACAATAPTPAPPTRILMIGNSLTAANDLPSLLAAVARGAGRTYEIQAVTGPGLALIDHLHNPSRAAATLAQHPWDYVILQQGPTPAGLCRDSLVLWTQLFDSLITPTGARPALFMTWPPRDAWVDLPDIGVSYAAAAHAVGGIFLPVGEAWRRAGSAVAPRLYGPDDFHPSPFGSYLAALTIFERLSGQDARSLSPAQLAPSFPIPLSSGDLRVLQDAAHEANTQSDPVVPPSPPGPPPPLPAGHC